MRRRYYSEDNSLDKALSAILTFYFFYLVYQYFTNRANFWKWLIYGLLVVVAIVFERILERNIRRKRFRKLIERIRNAGQEDYIVNFINRFGFEGKKGDSWSFRNHFFDWERINDLERVLLERNINLRSKKPRDIFKLLAYYIQKKEEELTRESIKKEPMKFSNLTSSEFEKLIYRLFSAMGYSVEWIGKSGDQGGDLIANKEGERLLIQAKCYRDWSTGNEAVQQAVGAMKYYDCSKTIVITTSYFTPEAIALAKANNTELIPKERLQKMLLDYLGESRS